VRLATIGTTYHGTTGHAASFRRDIDVPIIYPDEDLNPDKVTRLVVFGDSLSDAGRLNT